MEREDESVEVAFLRDELSKHEGEIQRLRAEGLNRQTHLTTTVSYIVSGVGGLAGLGKVDDHALRELAMLACVIVMALCAGAYQYSLGRDIASDSNARATGRIRQYFVRRHPGLLPHITWQLDDSPTHWIRKDRSDIRRTIRVLFVTAAVTGSIVVCVDLGRTTAFTAACGLGSAAVAYLLLKCWSKWKLSRAVRSALADQRFSRGACMRGGIHASDGEPAPQ